MGDHRIFDLKVLVVRRIWDACGNRNRATGAVVNIRNVVVDDRLPLADDANCPTSTVVVAEKEITLDARVVAVTQRQRALGVAKCVVAVSVVARLVRDDFNLAVGALETDCSGPS